MASNNPNTSSHVNVPTSRTAVVGALVAFGAFATAAVLFINGDATTERLGLLFAMFGTIVAALIAALRSDHAASQTNVSSNIAQALDGGFEDRVAAAVVKVMNERSANARKSDPPLAPHVEEIVDAR